MLDNQNLFYTSISKYYSEIFPYKPAQLTFVKEKVGELTEKNILDIGCATGELANKLAECGASSTGIDLNEDLLAQAVKNFERQNLVFQQGNMLELTNDFKENYFDAVLCFGNTLVHLQSSQLIEEMLKGVNKVLKPEGHFLLQILNYDYIIEEQIEELPLIETDSIRFIRNYEFIENSEKLIFKTQLEIKTEHKQVSNATNLLALKSKTLLEMLKRAGFKDIEIYANFKEGAFNGRHIPLVLSCVNC